jgi:hypothetical protein
MKKQTVLIFLALIITGLLSVSAAAQLNTHSVWTDGNGLVISDARNGCEYYSFDKFHMATSWTERTPGYPAQAHFRGIALAYGLTHGCNNHFYEFSLNNSVGTDSDTIKGYWDVYRDGTLMCSSCPGNAYALSGGVGNYYKLVIWDAGLGAYWNYVGYIDQRKDF